MAVMNEACAPPITAASCKPHRALVDAWREWGCTSCSTLCFFLQLSKALATAAQHITHALMQWSVVVRR